jgi:hypothetical protein
VALRSNAGQGLVIPEVSRSHTVAPQSVGISGRVISSWERLYLLKTHNILNRRTSMLQTGFKSAFSAGERSNSFALDSQATETGKKIQIQ